MKIRKVVYNISGVAIILINTLHALWYLDFTHVLWMIVFKFALFGFFLKELIKEERKLKVNIQFFRLILIAFFVILLGINKMNIGIQPFSGTYDVTEICTQDQLEIDIASKKVRLEKSEMNYGLYDSKRKTEIVYPLFLFFEWRYEITNLNEYESKFKSCHVVSN